MNRLIFQLPTLQHKRGVLRRYRNIQTLRDFRGLHEKFDEDVLAVFDFEASVERREAIGGPSRKMLDRQITVLRAAVAN